MPKTFLCKFSFLYLVLEMDATDMDFSSNVFTTVLDKGLLDAISSGYRSEERGKAYIREAWRVLKSQGIFILISHRADRIDQFINCVGWKSIKVSKVYKPLFEREESLIRKEFVSQEVLDQIEDKRTVHTKRPNDDEDADLEVVPYKDMPPYKRPEKKAPVITEETPQPVQVQCHYVYIC